MVVRNCCDPLSLLEITDQQSLARGGDPLPVNDDALLVQEFKSLTVQERERIYEEMHGIVHVIEETPEFVAEKLAAMRNYVKKISATTKKALDRAIFLRPSIQSDDKLHLMFLRAKKFDSFAAANVMVQHFENKLLLFGDDLLVKKITLECLTEREMGILRMGSIKMLRHRESQGRVIFFMTLGLYDCSDWKAFARYIWYQIYSTVEDDDDVQKKGLVQVVNLHGTFQSSTSQMVDFFYRTENFHKNWAFHVNCLHYCYGNPTLNAFLKGLVVFAGKDLRIRQRRHYGSPMEALYSLLTFGIRVHDCFVANEGILSTEHMNSYIEERHRIEESHHWIVAEKLSEDPKATFSLYPNKQDVLIGRGKNFREWPGNIRLAKMISLEAPGYVKIEAKDRIEKTIVAMKIISILGNDYGCRFLLPKENGWEVASESICKEKVSGALRVEARLLIKAAVTGTRRSSSSGSSISTTTILP